MNSEGANYENYENCEEREEREEGIISLIVHSKRLLNRWLFPREECEEWETNICWVSDSPYQPFELSSTVRSPHHFTAKRIEKDMIKTFHYFHAIVGTANGELRRFFAGFAVTVDGNQEVMATAFHI